jgi:hypothetical protein
MEDRRLDGNAAAGALGDVFTGDATLFFDTCAGCGMRTVQAEVRVYVDAPGTVLRCPGCDAVLMRLVRMPGRILVDFPALARVELPVTDPLPRRARDA